MSWDQLLHRAYVPYSKQPRACIIQGASGSYYPGVRVENVSFPVTVSAIHAALFHCFSEGDSPKTLIVEHQDFELLDHWAKMFSLSVVERSDISELRLFDPIISEIKDEQTCLADLLDTAIVPNSNFPVSALLKVGKGYIKGVNIEVKEWNLGLCAERVAIVKAISSGYTDFESLALHTRYGEFSSPCGACRQVITEQLPYHPIIFHHSDGSTSEHMTPDLLPYHFKSGYLKS